MKRSLIVSGSDEKYFDILWGFVRSIRYFEETREIDCVVIDAGLSPVQKEKLADLRVTVASIGWGFPFISGDVAKSLPLRVKCLTARPHLPDFFPGYDHYLWMDADTWIQSGKALAPFVAAADTADIAIVPELHHLSSYLYDPDSLPRLRHRHIYGLAYGAEIGQRLSMLPVHNAGVFAARADSPLWERWRQEMGETIIRSQVMNCDQATLNQLLYTRRLTAARLPAEYNWVCSALAPHWDVEEGRFISPGPLPRRIEVMHITGAALNQDGHDIQCRQGGSVHRSLLCPFPPVMLDDASGLVRHSPSGPSDQVR